MKRTSLRLGLLLLLLLGVSWRVSAKEVIYKGTITIYVGEEKTFSQYYVNYGNWFLREREGSGWSDFQENWVAKIVSKNSESCTIKGLGDNEDIYNMGTGYSLELHCTGSRKSNSDYDECYWKIIVKSYGSTFVDATPAWGYSDSPTMVEKGSKVYLTAKVNNAEVSGATIYYTTNGSFPTENSIKYTSTGITINEKTHIYAIAVKDGYSPVTCGGYYDVKTTIPVTSITLSKSSLSLQTGQSETLTATVLPSNATNKTVTWTSSNTSVATISATGKVTAKASGSATITCKANDGSGKQATCAVTVSEPAVAEINASNFPDANFRNWLLSQSYGADGKLTASEISSITTINVSGNSSSPGAISSLKGIEYFTSLTKLWCHHNQLTSLDVSKNTALTALYCYSNQLTSLDVSKNTALTWLECDDNQLTSLDVSKNTVLTNLYCYSNQLTSLDVSKNTALTYLSCGNNQLTSLDVSKNTALTYLSCYSNQLTSLDVSKNTALTMLNCCRNRIKGAAMDALISSLPQNQTADVHKFNVIDNSENYEGNVCTVAQVAAAKAKGWRPMYWNGTKWMDYEGSEEPNLGPDDLTDISQYGNIVYLEAVTASTESTITVPVKMKNAQANIIGFQFDLILPSGVSVAKDEDGFYLIELSTDRTTARKHTVSAQQQSDGSIRVVCYSNNNSTFSGTSGNVLEVTLQVAADAQTGEQSIKLRDVVMTTPGLDSYTVPWVVSRLTVEDYILGDVNGDKLVNVVDVAGVVNLILNSGNTSQLNRKAADVNGDGSINVVDVAGVVNIILGGGANARRTTPLAATGPSRLYIDDFSLEPGEAKTVSVNLSNPGDSFTGCQFDLYLPEGLTVEEEDGFPLVEIGNRTTARRHTVSATAQADGSLRVVCYSNNNYTFNGEDGEILTVALRAAGNALPGKKSVWMRNITLSRSDVTGVTLNDVSTEVTITGDDHPANEIVSVSAGFNDSWAINGKGELWSWGKTAESRTPTLIMNSVSAVSAGERHAMILKADGSLWACGSNSSGQLGDGTTTDRHMPVKVMDGVASVFAGGYHTMIVKTDGSLWACGSNRDGRLGDGTTTNRHTPVKVMDGVAAVSAGEHHTMIVGIDGSLWACGYNNSGELGDGTTTDRHTPVKVMNGVAAVSAGFVHTMIVKTDGSLWACGFNEDGQLGDGNINDSSTPMKVMDGVSAVSAGDSHTMIVKTDGSLWACGFNSYGQLGDGTTTSRLTPVKVMDGVVAVSAGNNHTMIVKTDGTLWACGSNSSGQLGDGTNTNRLTPVLVKFGDESAIPVVTSERNSGQFVHSLSGQRLAAPRKGVNIVGGRKVVVK